MYKVKIEGFMLTKIKKNWEIKKKNISFPPPTKTQSLKYFINRVEKKTITKTPDIYSVFHIQQKKKSPCSIDKATVLDPEQNFGVGRTLDFPKFKFT